MLKKQKLKKRERPESLKERKGNVKLKNTKNKRLCITEKTQKIEEILKLLKQRTVITN
jgi:hypothetical protein